MASRLQERWLDTLQVILKQTPASFQFPGTSTFRDLDVIKPRASLEVLRPPACDEQGES
jgi:hypothetical protein